jgi:hypothetical protein
MYIIPNLIICHERDAGQVNSVAHEALMRRDLRLSVLILPVRLPTASFGFDLTLSPKLSDQV